MAHGGSGLGSYQGRPVFVPYTLPGESITAEISGVKGRVLFARGKALVAASADRAEPRCPYFGPGACWGCQWQHIDYAAQLLLKQDVLADQLARVGKLPEAMIERALKPILPAPEQWAYNHSLSLLPAGTGGWGLRRQEGGIEAISDCHLAHPDLIDLFMALDLDFANAQRLTLRRGSDGRMMLIFHTDAEEAPELHADLPLSVNLILPEREPVNVVGDAHSHYEIGGRHYRVTAGSHMRANLGGVKELIGVVRQAAGLRGGERVLDLYGGVGIFSGALADASASIALVESYPPAVLDAEVNLAGSEHIEVVEAAVEAALDHMQDEGAQYDVAIVDPPASGLGESVVRRLRELSPGRVVYVSGNPAALARDSGLLVAAGFQLRALQPIDLAPQTYYIDAVACFTR